MHRWHQSLSAPLRLPSSVTYENWAESSGRKDSSCTPKSAICRQGTSAATSHQPPETRDSNTTTGGSQPSYSNLYKLGDRYSIAVLQHLGKDRVEEEVGVCTGEYRFRGGERQQGLLAEDRDGLQHNTVLYCSLGVRNFVEWKYGTASHGMARYGRSRHLIVGEVSRVALEPVNKIAICSSI